MIQASLATLLATTDPSRVIAQKIACFRKSGTGASLSGQDTVTERCRSSVTANPVLAHIQ